MSPRTSIPVPAATTTPPASAFEPLSETLTATVLGERLNAAIQAPDYQPPLLPEAALRLAELTRSGDVDFARIREVLQSEPMLTASVLRLAQSAAYRRAVPVRTIDQAMAHLGVRTLADLFLQVATSARIFRAPGFERRMKQLQEHSVATGHVMRLVCRAHPALADYAFLAGLLHDVGAAAGILLFGEGTQGKPRTFQESETIFHAVLAIHEYAGEALARAWSLPAETWPALTDHHGRDPTRPLPPMAAAVCIAEGMASELGFGFGEVIPDTQVARAREALGLVAVEYAQLRAEAQSILSKLREE